MAAVETLPWMIWIIVLPLLAAILVFLMPRYGMPLGLAAAVAIVFCVLGLTIQVVISGPVRHTAGGWDAPLGISLYADGLSVLMLLMTALVGLVISLYSSGYFHPPRQAEHASERLSPPSAFFWPLWMVLWAGLNALYLTADAFNAYVTLELIGLAAVALVALAGSVVALGAAMRYLLVSLLGSLCYLLGTGLLYADQSALDFTILQQSLETTPTDWAAMALMSTGLLLKTALFPLHFWLPPAHASAPAPVSAILSALVVKASFYLLLRLWLEVFPTTAVIPGTAQLLGWLGVGAIIWGSIQALQSQRLKLLVAYSTVAQLGYLFLVFPLLQGQGTGFTALAGSLYLVLSHAFAKAAMFLVAGIVLQVAGHDRIHDLGGTASRLPISMFALALAAVSLIGLPPSGGFIGKWLLLNASLVSGQWWWVIVIAGGSLLAAIYLFRLIGQVFRPGPTTPASHTVPRHMEWAAFTLALAAIILGLTASHPLALLRIGTPVSGAVMQEMWP